jgi:hypothetical protein
MVATYSSTGAPTGHTSAQAPQLRHSSALITYLPSFSTIAETGQASTQAPQAKHSSSLILKAILIYLHRIYFGYALPHVAHIQSFSEE